MSHQALLRELEQESVDAALSLADGTVTEEAQFRMDHLEALLAIVKADQLESREAAEATLIRLQPRQNEAANEAIRQTMGYDGTEHVTTMVNQVALKGPRRSSLDECIDLALRVLHADGAGVLTKCTTCVSPQGLQISVAVSYRASLIDEAEHVQVSFDDRAVNPATPQQLVFCSSRHCDLTCGATSLSSCPRLYTLTDGTDVVTWRPRRSAAMPAVGASDVFLIEEEAIPNIVPEKASLWLRRIAAIEGLTDVAAFIDHFA